MSALWNEGWIRQVRQGMYAGSGYVILRAFVSVEEALRIRRFWLERAKEGVRTWFKRPAPATGEEEYPVLIRPVEKLLRGLDSLSAADLERRRADLAAGRLPAELYAGNGSTS